MLSVRRIVKVLVEDAHATRRSFGKYANTVRPVAVRNTNHQRRNNPITTMHKFNDRQEIDVDEVRKEFKRELKHEFHVKGDIAETDLDNLSQDDFQNQALEERERVKSKIRKGKMYRKHFRDILGGEEISVLTYAEKEKIRYLHSTNPEEWTPEALSASFPVSPEGVLKLVKSSSCKTRSIQEMQVHDKLVAEKIDQIKNGVIPMTPDLEEKMKMREKLPLNIGAFDPYDKNMLLKFEPVVKVIGEFQQLVSPPAIVQKDSETSRTALSLVPTSRYGTNSSSSKIPPISTDGRQQEPDLGDFYDMEPTPSSKKEFRKLKISLRKVMTFDEFKSKMKLGGGEKSNDMEIQHLAKLDADDAGGDKLSKVIPTTLADFEKDEASQGIHNGFRAMTKFKSQESESTVLSSSERTNKDEAIDYRKQLMNEKGHERRVNIPKNSSLNTSTKNKHDVVYQQGTSFYDDNGEFLYKVV